jgi:hypothetical protein
LKIDRIEARRFDFRQDPAHIIGAVPTPAGHPNAAKLLNLTLGIVGKSVLWAGCGLSGTKRGQEQKKCEHEKS